MISARRVCWIPAQGVIQGECDPILRSVLSQLEECVIQREGVCYPAQGVCNPVRGVCDPSSRSVQSQLGECVIQLKECVIPARRVCDPARGASV